MFLKPFDIINKFVCSTRIQLFSHPYRILFDFYCYERNTSKCFRKSMQNATDYSVYRSELIYLNKMISDIRRSILIRIFNETYGLEIFRKINCPTLKTISDSVSHKVTGRKIQ